MPVNELNQIVAEPIPDWEPRPHPENVTLEGKLCTIVPLDPEIHCPVLFEAYQLEKDNGMWTFLPFGPYKNADELTEAFDHWMKTKDDTYFAIIDNKTKKPVGQYSLRRCDPTNGVVEVGGVIFSPLLKRSRTATEAHYLLAEYVFDTLHYRRYEWQCNSLNKPSHNAAVRMGFQFEGVHRQISVVKGRNRDTHWLSMLDHEWPVCKQAFEKWLDDSNFDADGMQLQRLQEIRVSLST
ncbi:similar to Saccharomyces cerevisiae YIR042C Putative protein of unknown function [Maudiozyma saulgeensis]|uniref:N-acetyltransferase domain-containing protein n=1 Tax=Maudiozyma saulgeensis TaxID=1789683 RepID=A0A1X7R0D7_9SACH|nr:similar to Saccharomyces cerevisiae YIR042C Putative protein of unknown function [Kazachstania saulgeensis]